MITSVIGRGLIYAGDTSFALTIAVEQTGPMQLTVRAGSFTSTGQRRKDHNGAWLPWIEEPKTYALAADRIIDLASDPTRSVAYDVDLVSDGATTDVLITRTIVGVEESGPLPPGRVKIHELLFKFVLPPGCADVMPIDICALTVMPGFPPGTGPDDWIQQMGSG